jgi:Virulence-associated protein and related proteins
MPTSTLTTRVFMNGNSQAVRIPQEFRLDVSSVEITRKDNGDLVIHPIPQDRGAALIEALQGFDDDFIEALEEEQRDQPAVQDRDEL